MKTEESDPSPLGQSEAPAKSARGPAHRHRRLGIAFGVVVAAAVLFVGVPRALRALHTVSTDDAYVNGYVTFVAPRVSGQAGIKSPAPRCREAGVCLFDQSGRDVAVAFS